MLMLIDNYGKDIAYAYSDDLFQTRGGAEQAQASPDLVNNTLAQINIWHPMNRKAFDTLARLGIIQVLDESSWEQYTAVRFNSIK